MSLYKRRGSTLMLVLWAIGITTLILLSLQLSAYRQAHAGRDAMNRLRATWAARGGMEAVIHLIGQETEDFFDYDPGRFSDELMAVAMSSDDPADPLYLYHAEYEISHTHEWETVPGPADAHAKLNVNTMVEDQWWFLPDITEEQVASILDWMDGDDEVRDGGAESEYYTTMEHPYEPANGRISSLRELELIKAVEALDVRGEDWNLNGLLDPSENDGDLTWPPDDEDGQLDAGWSAYLTVDSVDGGWADSGQERIDLLAAEPDEVSSRLGVSYEQAEALATFAKGGSAMLATLLSTPLSQFAGGDQNQGGVVDDLDDGQLRVVFAEATIGNKEQGQPGRVNINTCSYELLEFLPGVDLDLADQIDYQRRSIPFQSEVDLLSIGDMEPEWAEELAGIVCVKSNVFVVTSRGMTGRGTPGETEVELVVTIDRSQLPIRIIEYIER